MNRILQNEKNIVDSHSSSDSSDETSNESSDDSNDEISSINTIDSIDETSVNSGSNTKEELLMNEEPENDEILGQQEQLQQRQQEQQHGQNYNNQLSFHSSSDTNQNHGGLQMLLYRIIEVSSEDPNYPVSQLGSYANSSTGNNNISNHSSHNAVGSVVSRKSNSEGWQSEQNCTYPQYIIIQPLESDHGGINDNSGHKSDDNTNGIHLTKMKILIHNIKIPEKIEIFTSTSSINPSSFNESNSIQLPILNDGSTVVNEGRISRNATKEKTEANIAKTLSSSSQIKFQRLGYITFDNNMKTSYRARELKSISLNVRATYIKLVIHACHGYDNKLNQSMSAVTRSSNGRNKNSVVSNLLKENNEMTMAKRNHFYQVGIVNLGLFQKKAQSNVVQKIKEKPNNGPASTTTAAITTATSSTRDKEKASIGTNTTLLEEIIKNDSIPSTSTHRQQVASSAKNLQPMNSNDIVELKSRVAKMEQVMRKMAEKEEFDVAAQIKVSIVKINDALENLQTLQIDMHRAAESEDYVEASRLKTKRDKARGVAMNALDEAEANVDTSVITHNGEPGDDSHHQRIKEIRLKHDHLEDLSLSTIRRLDEDDPSIAMTMTGRSFQINVDDRPIPSRQELSHHSQEEHVSERDVNANIKELSHSDEFDNSREHPLQGIPNYENLPKPEEIFHQGEGALAMSLNSSSSLASMDSLAKIESILGQYRAKCLFSKNWSLREAVILKLSMILPSTVEKFKEDNHIGINWWDAFSRGLCIILDRALSDKVVQVFLSGLILLDDCINEFEKLQIPHKETISLLGNIVINLVDKISSSNQKVVEGAETALMSLALYDGIGPSYIGTQVMKQKPSKGSKGKLLCTRFRLLRDIVDEFGNDAPNGQKLMDFVKAFGFGHKDADVRENVKELTTVIFLRDGQSVISMLDGLSERQLKEYKISFASAQKERTGNERKTSRGDKSLTTIDSDVAKNNRVLSSNGIETKLSAPTPRGRGRGRGRNTQRMDNKI